MPCVTSSGPGPIPDSRSSFGDAIAPALTTTSDLARAVCRRPECSHSTPTQRVPSTSSRRAVARVTTRRLGALMTGRT